MLHFLNQAWIKSKLTIQPKKQTNKQEKKLMVFPFSNISQKWCQFIFSCFKLESHVLQNRDLKHLYKKECSLPFL